MSLSAKFMIGVFTLYFLGAIICGWFDGQTTIYNATNVVDMGKLGEYSSVTGVETTGETSNIFQWAGNTKDAIVKIIEFDYSFWYDSYTGYTETTCEAADGRWNSSNSLCRFPNAWEVVHSSFLRPIGWALLLAFVSIGIGMFRGR